jgi:hypothetical protein
MKRLTVFLAYGAASAHARRGPDASLALPVRVLDADGSVLGEGASSVDAAATIDLPETADLVFVRLSWPSGRSEVQRVSLANTSTASVTFSDNQIAPNEWSAWAVPKLNPNTPLKKARVDLDLGLDRFDRVWLRLWKFGDGAWSLQKIVPDATYRNGAVWQLDFSLEQFPWMLQIGGPNVVWRCVSLPGGGPARVLITPKDSTDPRADALKVVVTGFRADAETLLEFLARDSMRAVDSLARSEALAKQLFADKFSDPVSAVAGAYYLLRVDAWQRIPRSWFENLWQSFPWVPDTAVIYCIRLLREGRQPDASATVAFTSFVECLRRGWPLYGEGIALLQEASAVLRGTEPTEHVAFDQVQALGAAKAWAGAAASFYGRSPDTPSARQWVGMPSAPRRRRLNRLPLSEGEQLTARLPPSASRSPQEHEPTKRLPVRVRRDSQEFLLNSIKR